MRTISAFLGVVMGASSVGCLTLGSLPRGQVTSSSHVIDPIYPEETRAKSTHVELEPRALTLAAIDCILAPAVYRANARSAASGDAGTYGPETTPCVTAAHAAGTLPLRLYRLDADATFEVRRAIQRQAAGSHGGSVVVGSAPFVSLFEKTVAAVSEGRRASAALLRDPVAVDAGAIDSLRAHEMVVALDDFGRQTSGEVGAYARTIAMVIAANNFLLVGRVPAAQRPFAAEPLLTMMLGSEFLSYGSDEPTVTWAEYIGAAGRSIEAAPGGASAADSEGERDSLAKVVQFAGSELRTVSEKLASSDPLHRCAEHTLQAFAAYPVETVVTAAGEPSAPKP